MENRWTFKESLKRCFPIAAVEFGILCGPSMASGAYATNYFSKWGPQGLWMILFWMVLMGISVFCGMYFASAFGVHNYGEFYKKMYGEKIYKYASPVLDIYAIIGGIISEGAQCTLGGVMFNTLFGWHPLVGASLMAIVIIILMLWGDELVRRGAAIMTFILLAGFAILLYYAINIRGGVIAQYLGNYNLYEEWGSGTLGAGFKTVFLYALSCMACPTTLCNVNQKQKPGVGDAAMIAVLTPVLVSVLFLVNYMITIGFAPDSLAQSTPNLYIVTEHIKVGWVTFIYYFVMFFALASSGPGLTYNVVNRFGPVIFKNSKLSKIAINGITAVVFNVICVIFSTVGLTAIVTKGFTTMGAFAGPLIVAPMVLTTVPRAYKKLKADKEAAASAE